MLFGVIGVTMHYLRFGPKQVVHDHDLEGEPGQDPKRYKDDGGQP
jgi:hypothetical protein